jgi:hypothetical protein
MRSTIASTARPNSAPSSSRRSSYQRRVSRTSSSASGRNTTRRVTLLATVSGERRTMGSRCRVSSRGRPTGDPAQPAAQDSTPAPPRARRRTGFPTAPSPDRPYRREGAATVARVCWIPWRDSLMHHSLRQAGASSCMNLPESLMTRVRLAESVGSRSRAAPAATAPTAHSGAQSHESNSTRWTRWWWTHRSGTTRPRTCPSNCSCWIGGIPSRGQ